MITASQPLTLSELLVRSGIAPEEVLVFRHRPWEPKLNRAFDWIVAERRDLFDCYQDSHAPRTEAALLRARYVASFIRHGSGSALFVGLYERRDQMVMPEREYRARPLHQELMKLGMSGDFSVKDGRDTVMVFDLVDTQWHAEWSGCLAIKWPGLERSWYRWADRNSFEVTAIAPQSMLVAPLPSWDELVLKWAELSVIPTHWRSAIAQWRGIYLITDGSDNRHYIGSASGTENILQRWLDYAKTGHGGNKHLRARKPENFRFAILQLVAPDLPKADVEKLEQKWKARLGTTYPHGLNGN
ncbi:MAG: GIY-YIG nuclease family protein [Sphingopyxis sp.]